MKTRTPNYKTASTPSTIRKQIAIRELLKHAEDGLSVREVAKALGISRQLALYHVKKLAAVYGCVMVLEPCAINGGLQFRVWDEMSLAAHYSRLLPVQLAA